MLPAKEVFILPCLSVLLLFSLAGPALADSVTGNKLQITKQLAELKQTAADLRHQADLLDSMTPNRHLSWQSHADRLETLKDHVNEMGKSLAELEAQKAMATQEQALGIEHVRLHLVPVAHNLTKAIELVNENRSNVHRGEYGDTVSDIYAHAETLHTKLDTIIDYHNARMRFDRLELQPALTSSE